MDQQIAEKNIPPLDRIGVGVDPAETETGNDDTGIIIAEMSGSGIRSTGYVLDDRTIHDSPDAAANAVVRAYMDWNASFVNAEPNITKKSKKVVLMLGSAVGEVFRGYIRVAYSLA